MRKFLKIAGITLSAIIALLLLTYLFVYISMRNRINKQYAFNKETITIVSDSAAIANGRHLAAIRGCNDCHGNNFGGKILMDNGMMGRLSSSNLTHGKGGLPADFAVEDWIMALRHGVNKNGKPLLMMPSHETALLSKKDLTDIIAYAQQLPPVDNEIPAIKPGPVIYIMAYLDKFPLLTVEKIDHAKSLEQAQTIPGSMAQGKYLSVTCQGCHRANMKGGEPVAPGLPQIPDVTSTGAAGRINLQEFTAILRTGKNENGRQMDNENMPWKMTAQYTDEEIKALYTYLHSL